MRYKSLLTIMFLLMLAGKAFSAPTFTETLTNDAISADGKVWSFDIYVKGTGDQIEVQNIQWGLTWNQVGCINGGTCVGTWVPGSQDASLVTSGQNAQTINMTTAGVIKIAAKNPPGGPGTGFVLQTSGLGTHIGRIQVTNTVQFVNLSHAGLAFCFTTSPYPTKLNAYIAGVGTSIGGDGVTGGPNGTYTNNLTDLPLPVEIGTFTSAAQGRSVVLNWSTKTEKNSDRFEVQRSLVSNSVWSTVGTVKASVLSNSPKNYSYTDTKLQSGKYQYRLKLVDNNGTFAYSATTETEVALPKDFAVSQNYPNPFNPSTKIDYQVPMDAKVIMEVYNIAGQRVSELVNQNQTAGYYTVDFGATKLSSGVYIYRISAQENATGKNFSSIKKMMLLK